MNAHVVIVPISFRIVPRGTVARHYHRSYRFPPYRGNGERYDAGADTVDFQKNRSYCETEQWEPSGSPRPRVGSRCLLASKRELAFDRRRNPRRNIFAPSLRSLRLTI